VPISDYEETELENEYEIFLSEEANNSETMFLIRIRLLLIEWLAVFIGIVSGIIKIVGTVYQFRKVIRKAGAALWRARIPLSIATLVVFAQWLRSGVNPSTLWNFPPGATSPFPHLSLYAAPLLDILTYSWLGALALSSVYSSRSRLGRFSWASDPSKRFMMVTLLFYPALVLWFGVSAEISFLIPSWAQTPLWLVSAFPLSFVVFRSVETMIGRRIFGKQGLVSITVDKALRVASIGMRSIGEWSYGNYRYVYSRFTGKPLEVVPHPNVRPTIGALLVSLSLITMTAAYELGYTSMLELFYAFGVAPYALMIAAGVVGWRKRKRENEEKKRVVLVPKRLRSKFKFFSVMFDLLLRKDP